MTPLKWKVFQSLNINNSFLIFKVRVCKTCSSRVVDLHSGWLAITTPVVGQMCHIKEVRYWFCFPVKHLVAVMGDRETKTCLLGLICCAAVTVYNDNAEGPSSPCSVIKGDGCCARRCIQSLLRTSVQDVNIWECNERQITSHTVHVAAGRRI